MTERDDESAPGGGTTDVPDTPASGVSPVPTDPDDAAPQGAETSEAVTEHERSVAAEAASADAAPTDPAPTDLAPTDPAAPESAADAGAAEELSPAAAARARRGAARGRLQGRAPQTATRPARVPIAVVRRSVEDTAALRESLAEKEAEAYDLRLSIEQLRQELSAERAVVASRPRRVTWPWWLLLGVVALVLLLLALSQCSGRDAGPSLATPTPSDQNSGAVVPSGGASATASATVRASATATSGASTTGTPSAPATATGGASASAPASVAPAPATTPMRWGSGAPLLDPPGVPTSGPGIDAAGNDVTYALDADGTSVDVYERFVSSSPITTLTATVPAVNELIGDLGRARLGVSDLQVTLDGTAVRPTQTGDTTWTASLPGGATATKAVLRYRLNGAVVRVEPAPPGRLAGLLTPLTASSSLGSDQPVVVRVVADGLRSLTCPTATGGAVLCGTVSNGTASATLPKGTKPVVQLQFDRR